MNKVTNSLIALLITLITPCYAMDVEPKQPEKTYLPTIPMPSGEEFVSKMPPEVLEHILTFVIGNDPDAIGNLARIQEVCKGLAGLLSKDEMKWILGITDVGVSSYLMDAIKKLDIKKVQLLINLGPAQDFKRESIFYAIAAAALSDQKDYYQRLLQIIAILEKAGATWKGGTYNNPESTLEYVVILKNMPLTRLLLDHGVRPTEQSLDHAIRYREIELSALLLKHGAPTSQRQLRDILLLDYDPQFLKLLVTYGADVQRPDDNGRTPLDLASSADEYMETKVAQSAKNAQILIDAGAVPTTDNLCEAAWRNNAELVSLFITHGANVNATGNPPFNNPPLYYTRNAQVAKILLQAGAELSIDCSQGKTVLQNLVEDAKLNLNPMILVEVLKQRYPFQTALAIATAIMAGAPYIRAVCTIL